MIPGSGPGRGVPWWRHITRFNWRWSEGPPEPVGIKREGRTVVALPPPRVDTFKSRL